MVLCILLILSGVIPVNMYNMILYIVLSTCTTTFFPPDMPTVYKVRGPSSNKHQLELYRRADASILDPQIRTSLSHKQ